MNPAWLAVFIILSTVIGAMVEPAAAAAYAGSASTVFLMLAVWQWLDKK